MGELEKNEYVEDRNEEGLNGEESKSKPSGEQKSPMNLGLHFDMQNALKEKFKEEFVLIQEELEKQKQIAKEAIEKKEQIETE